MSRSWRLNSSRSPSTLDRCVFSSATSDSDRRVSAVSCWTESFAHCPGGPRAAELRASSSITRAVATPSVPFLAPARAFRRKLERTRLFRQRGVSSREQGLSSSASSERCCSNVESRFSTSAGTHLSSGVGPSSASSVCKAAVAASSVMNLTAGDFELARQRLDRCLGDVARVGEPRHLGLTFAQLCLELGEGKSETVEVTRHLCIRYVFLLELIAGGPSS